MPRRRTPGAEPAAVEVATTEVVALGLGSNLGAREANLIGALAGLLPLLRDIRLAPLFETPAQPPGPHPDFLNSALVGRCALPPDALLAGIKRIERGLGRAPSARNAPRLIDIDLLLYGSLESRLPEIEVPHPRLRERHFVLAPLARVAADWPVPPDQRPVEALLADLGPGEGIREVPWTMNPLPRP